MTSRERLLCAMRGGAPDRVPVAPIGLGNLDPTSAICRELVARTDPIISVWVADPFMSATAAFTSEDEDDTTTTLLETPRGVLTQRVMHNPTGQWTVEHFCKSPADLDAFISIPFEPPEPNAESFRDNAEHFGDEALVMAELPNAVMLPARLLSEHDLCMLWATEPRLIEEITNEAQRRLDGFVERACRAGVDAFRILGGEFVTVLLGPDAFDRLIAPHDGALVARMHHHNAIACYHNHGPIMRWLDGLARLGIDALEPLEAPPCGDADLRRAAEILAGRVCMIGNLDDMEVLEKLPRTEVMEWGRELLRSVGGKNFILGGSASGTFGERAAANFIALAEMAATGQ